MFIDGKVQFPNEAQPEPVKTARNAAGSATGAAGKPSGVSSGSGEDTVSLSRTHSQAQVLASSLSTVPEVRTERVNSLRAQVSAGSYQPATAKVADAILRDHGKLG